MTMLQITDVLATKRCDDYPDTRVRELASGRDSVPWDDVAGVLLSLPRGDARYIISQLLSQRSHQHAVVWAADCAERVAHLAGPEARDALDLVRRWLRGEAVTADELRLGADAAYAANYAAYAARSAVIAYSAAAAWDAAWDAAAASWAAARAVAAEYSVAAAEDPDAEHAWQVERAIGYLSGQRDPGGQDA